LEHLAELLADRPDAAELADSSLKAALRGAALTQRMLAFARRQVLAPRVMPLTELIHDVAPLLRQTLGERIRLVLQVAPGTWPVFVDSVQLESSLINLAANARDAMPRGGSFSIHTGNLHLDTGSDDDLPDGDYVSIDVTDTGSGMTEDVRQRAFEPFFTTKPVGQGSGLGLSMVFGFISQSKGTIAIESSPGRGTTFRLLLPRSLEVVPDTRAEATPPARPGHGECVLIVEDDAGVRTMLIRLTKALGYRHLVAANGDEALKMLERQAVDVVLSDVVMPGAIDGVALARLVRMRWPQTKMVLSSGYVNVKPDGEGMVIPDGVSFLAKPYNMKQMASVLADALGA
jgi:CheY-like chemotaxis protein